MTAQPQQKDWDRYAILAEVRRQGKTLTGIARDAGLYEGACRQGLIGNSRAGAEAIAQAIGVPFAELFKGDYPNRPRRRPHLKRNDRCQDSAQLGNPVDSGGQAA